MDKTQIYIWNTLIKKWKGFHPTMNDERSHIMSMMILFYLKNLSIHSNIGNISILGSQFSTLKLSTLKYFLI